MARNFSDIFRSDDSDQSNSSNTNSDTNADGNTDVHNDGINLSTESYSQDQDGNVQYDHSSLDTGDTSLGGDLNIDNVLDNVSDSMSSSMDDLGIDN